MATTAKAVLEQLKSKGGPENVKGMGKFGMATDQRLGVPVPEMRKIAKGIGKDHALALELWKTGVQEARIEAAVEIQQIDSKAARWIASDAMRELESEKIQARLGG